MCQVSARNILLHILAKFHLPVNFLSFLRISVLLSYFSFFFLLLITDSFYGNLSLFHTLFHSLFQSLSLSFFHSLIPTSVHGSACLLGHTRGGCDRVLRQATHLANVVAVDMAEIWKRREGRGKEGEQRE